MISLVSIVRNEEAVIERFLDSALSVCAAATVVDTGSTDGTLDALRARGISPIQVPFEGFGHARSVAFMGAFQTADWLLTLDADCTVELDPGFAPDPAVDAYMIEMGSGDFTWRLPWLLNGMQQWQSVGRVHEYTTMPNGWLGRREATDKVRVTHHDHAGRSSIAKTRRYLSLLWDDWGDDADNPRTTFYMGQTYAELGATADAISWYDRRVTMGGFEEEVYVAALRAARLSEGQDQRDRFFRAWMLRPERLEAAWGLARALNAHGDHVAAYAVSSAPQRPSTDMLFVEPAAWRYGLDFERHIAAWWVDKYDESQRIGKDLLTRDLPGPIRAAVERNLAFGPRER